jgi:carbamoyltransferase
MQSTLNLKIKQREGFRPFAPAVLAERAGDFFELDVPSPYMLLVAQVRGASSPEPTSDREDLLARIRAVSSPIPAVTHVDGSARVQTVSREDNPRFHALLAAFERETGCPVLVNTSFNLRGEPIVGTPEDAFRTFLSTEMDVLCLGPFVLERRDQPPLSAEDRVAPELD